MLSSNRRKKHSSEINDIPQMLIVVLVRASLPCVPELPVVYKEYELLYLYRINDALDIDVTSSRVISFQTTSTSPGANT